MSGNSRVKVASVKASEILKRKKPAMQKVKIKIIVESEKETRDGIIEDEWLASMSMTEVMEKIIEAVEEIE